ncbi:MAG: tRNA (adenosine(37)-N6)-dimethylallyltransferase MiaA [Magnetococcales bacterium]|nr:tRNA (adenosine(37)-N6)-dimethylallyltransferase MiaA [Magnetococcales bacterium]
MTTTAPLPSPNPDTSPTPGSAPSPNLFLPPQTNLIVVLGATATGKTALGVQLARHFNGEIISADSRQVYRGMDIGTGKDLKEYGEIPYHGIDVVEPGDEFSLFDFQTLFGQAFQEIQSRQKLPILVGGTGLYLEAVLLDYHLPRAPKNQALREELAPLDLTILQNRLKRARPTQHNTTDLIDRERLIRAIEIAEANAPPPPQTHPTPPLKPLVLGIRFERTQLRKRITQRLKARMQEGFIEEVARLHQEGVSFKTLEAFGLEYRFAALHLQGQLNRNDMFQKLNSAIHQFAKRQETWFRRMEKRGIVIHWLPGDGEPFEACLEFLNVETHTAETKHFTRNQAIREHGPQAFWDTP